MIKNIPDLMRDARTLVSGRRLEEATALIQQALTGGKTGPGAPSHRGPTIELEAGRIAASALDEKPASSSMAEKLAPFLAMRPRFQMPTARPGAEPVELPEGARFETHVYAGAEGTRSYKLYVPASLPSGPRPLILMLHGCTQDPDDFARGTRMNAAAEEGGFLVAYPEQPSSGNARLCWNWFEPAHQRRDRGEPAEMAGIVREIAAARSVDPKAVFVAGLSAGGAMAAVLGEAYPDLFAGVGVHSGLPFGAASDVGSALSLMRSGKGVTPAAGRRADASRLIVFHGDADRTVHPANGDAVAGPSQAGESVDRGVAGGRGYTRLVRKRNGRPEVEVWRIEGLGHAWSGGDAGGTYADPAGPDATREMVRFFMEKPARS